MSHDLQIVITGKSGTGKSTLAELIRDQLKVEDVLFTIEDDNGCGEKPPETPFELRLRSLRNQGLLVSIFTRIETSNPSRYDLPGELPSKEGWYTKHPTSEKQVEVVTAAYCSSLEAIAYQLLDLRDELSLRGECRDLVVKINSVLKGKYTKDNSDAQT